MKFLYKILVVCQLGIQDKLKNFKNIYFQFLSVFGSFEGYILNMASSTVKKGKYIVPN